ncbi:hypothetical protein ABZ499_21795 [Streptomyces sp. NPDC019990]|uniref:hypothetical protein n=1 Tax=Streptomyces sp. NPDC019990 TaxID=3154693 RepID=UPI0033E0634D
MAKKYDAAAAEKKASAEKAKDTYDQAAQHPDLKLASQSFPSQEEADAATARLRAAEKELSQASTALAKANDEYESLNRKIKELESEHSSEAETIAKALDNSTKDAPDEPGFWEKVGECCRAWIGGHHDSDGDARRGARGCLPEHSARRRPHLLFHRSERAGRRQQPG